jgi:hypothetical protein
VLRLQTPPSAAAADAVSPTAIRLGRAREDLLPSPRSSGSAPPPLPSGKTLIAISVGDDRVTQQLLRDALGLSSGRLTELRRP